MKGFFKKVVGLASIAAVTAGAYYFTKKILDEKDEELEDFDFDDDFLFPDEEKKEGADDESREYVTLDIEDDSEEETEENAADEKSEESEKTE